MKKNKPPTRTCADCIHEYACKCWTCGRALADENAARCPAFETTKDSSVYLIGFLDGQKTKRPGQWIPHQPGDVYACSECGCGTLISARFKNRQCIDSRGLYNRTDFCPFCGVKMDLEG